MADEQKEKKIDFEKLSESLRSVKVTAERGIAITVVAKLDDLLGQLLWSFFIHNEKVCDELLDVVPRLICGQQLSWAVKHTEPVPCAMGSDV